jgi:hypothetical protein
VITVIESRTSTTTEVSVGCRAEHQLSTECLCMAARITMSPRAWRRPPFAWPGGRPCHCGDVAAGQPPPPWAPTQPQAAASALALQQPQFAIPCMLHQNVSNLNTVTTLVGDAPCLYACTKHASILETCTHFSSLRCCSGDNKRGAGGLQHTISASVGAFTSIGPQATASMRRRVARSFSPQQVGSCPLERTKWKSRRVVRDFAGHLIRMQRTDVDRRDGQDVLSTFATCVSA